MLILLIAGLALAPGALVAHAKSNGPSAHASGIPGLPGFVELKEQDNLKDVPGDPVKGLAVFRAFCSGCHNFMSAGLQNANKPGSDLDDRKPTYAKIVTLIAQGGGGGAFSRELLQDLTFEQIYDVAKYVALYEGKPGPVKGATLQPPVPVSVTADLTDGHAAVQGHFTGTLQGIALRWKIHVGKGANQPAAGRIVLGAVSGRSVKPVKLDCVRCYDEGSGFALLTPLQAEALALGRATVIIPASDVPNSTIGALRGSITSGH